MGATACKADLQELVPLYCSGVHFREIKAFCGVRDDCQDGFEERTGEHYRNIKSFCCTRDDFQDGFEERASSYPFPAFVLEVPGVGPGDESGCYLDAKTPRWEAQRVDEKKNGDTPVLPESFPDEEDDEEANPVHVKLDIAKALQDKGGDKYELSVDSAQSDEMEAAVRIVDLDSWERASDQHPAAQLTLHLPDKAAMCVEGVREAAEKVLVDIDIGADDVKQIPNLACLTSDVDQTRIPCNISDTTDTNSSFLSRRLYVPKVTHFLNSLSTCRSNSSTEEERPPCLQQINIDKDTESMDSKILDGVWMLDDGEHVAVVNGSDVKLLGDDADFSCQLQALGAGVWAITMDDEDFLADCSEREDGRLLLHWSDGVTWVRKEEGTAADSVPVHGEKLQDKCQSPSSSSSSSRSSSLSSSDSSLAAWSSGEAAELVPAAEASKAGKTIDVVDFEHRICTTSEADKAGGFCKVDKVGQARHPSKADKLGGVDEAGKTIGVDDVNQDGQIHEVFLANAVGEGAMADQAAGEGINVGKTGGAGKADDTSKASKTIDAENVDKGGKFNEADWVCEARELIEGKAAKAVQS